VKWRGKQLRKRKRVDCIQESHRVLLQASGSPYNFRSTESRVTYMFTLAAVLLALPRTISTLTMLTGSTTQASTHAPVFSTAAKRR
jgi:hypothetical protein